MAVGCDHHSDRLPAAVGAGGVCGDEESEAAARRQTGRQQDEAPHGGVRQPGPVQGAGVTGRPSSAENEEQPGKREDRLEEKEESKGIRKKEEEGALGGGCQSNAVRTASVAALFILFKMKI